MSEMISASELNSELTLRVIPALKIELEEAMKARMALGLRKDARDPFGARFIYPPTLTRAEAYLKAREFIGGDFFAQTRKQLKHLEVSRLANETQISSLEVRRDKYFLIGRIVANNAQTLHKLSKTKAHLDATFQASAARYRSQVLALRTPEKRAQIKFCAESLMSAELALANSRKESDERFANIQLELGNAKELQLLVSKLGNNKISILRQDSGNKLSNIPKLAELPTADRLRIVPELPTQKKIRIA